jgi:ATP-binding cassette subfamily B protein
MVRFRPKLYLLDACLNVAGWILFLVPGFITQAIFNTLSQNIVLNQNVWALIALLLISQAVRMSVSLSAIAVDTTFSQTLTALIRKNMLASVLTHPGARALPDSPGEAISRFREDVDDTVEFVGMSQMLDLLGAFVFGIIALVIMMRINVLITCCVFIPLSCIVIIAQMATKRLKRYHQANRETTGRVTSLSGEMFRAVQAIHAANAVDLVVARFQMLNEQRRQAIVRDQVFTQALNSVFFNAVNLGIGAVLLLSAQAMHANTFTVGDFALFVYFLTWVTQLTNRFGTLLAEYKQIGISINRLTDLLQGGLDVALVESDALYLNDPIPSLPPITKTQADRLETLSVTGLSYHYPTSSRGISAMDLTLQRGSFTVITGRVGSGKTCFLRTILGLLPMDAGEICWNGQIVEDPATFFVPPRSAYTPQIPRLFSTSLQDNILLGLPIEDPRDTQRVSSIEPFHRERHPPR